MTEEFNPYSSSESLEQYLCDAPHSRLGLASLACWLISGVALAIMFADVVYTLTGVRVGSHRVHGGLGPLMIYVSCTALIWVLAGVGSILAVRGIKRDYQQSSLYAGLALNVMTPVCWFCALGLAKWLVG